MRNIAYFGWSGSPDQETTNLFRNCIKTLKEVSDVDIYVTTFPGILDKDIEELVTPMYVSNEQWDNRRLTAKLEKMLEIKMEPGDRFYYCDGDLSFRSDPFKVFDEYPDMDVFYTERHYQFEFPVNGGVWGFKHSEEVEKFRQWFVSQVQNPTWEPYVYLRNNHPYVTEFDHKDWWVDQDFLNCIHWRTDWVNHDIGTKLNIKNVGYKYNLIVQMPVEEVIKQYDPVIMHFKSGGSNRWYKDVNLRK